jgi:hypothetical protein
MQCIYINANDCSKELPSEIELKKKRLKIVGLAKVFM